MEAKTTRVELKIVLSDASVRLYGNRAFFGYLRAELDRLVDCPPHGYCEFQTISLEAERPSGLSQKPKYTVLRLGDDEVDLSNAQLVPNGTFDLIFMSVEDEDD